MLEGKAAVVTGGGRGPGRAYAVALATSGASVVDAVDAALGYAEVAAETVDFVEAAGGVAVADRRRRQCGVRRPGRARVRQAGADVHRCGCARRPNASRHHRRARPGGRGEGRGEGRGGGCGAGATGARRVGRRPRLFPGRRARGGLPGLPKPRPVSPAGASARAASASCCGGTPPRWSPPCIPAVGRPPTSRRCPHRRRLAQSQHYKSAMVGGPQ